MSNVPRLLGSSADPNKYALTFKGLAIGLVPMIIIVAKMFNVELAESELLMVIEQISLAISGVVVVIGVIRKIWLWGKEKFWKQ